jgi:hypothetical protein
MTSLAWLMSDVKTVYSRGRPYSVGISPGQRKALACYAFWIIDFSGYSVYRHLQAFLRLPTAQRCREYYSGQQESWRWICALTPKLPYPVQACTKPVISTADAAPYTCYFYFSSFFRKIGNCHDKLQQPHAPFCCLVAAPAMKTLHFSTESAKSVEKDLEV